MTSKPSHQNISLNRCLGAYFLITLDPVLKQSQRSFTAGAFMPRVWQHISMNDCISDHQSRQQQEQERPSSPEATMYKKTWILVFGEELARESAFVNEHDNHTFVAMKDEWVVGHTHHSFRAAKHMCMHTPTPVRHPQQRQLFPPANHR